MAKKKATRKTHRRARGGATSDGGGGSGGGMPTFPLEITLGNGLTLIIEGPTRR